MGLKLHFESARTLILQRAAKSWLNMRLAGLVLDTFQLPAGPCVMVANHSCVLDSAVAITISSMWRRPWKVLAHPRIVGRYGWLYGDNYLSVGTGPIEVARSITSVASILRESPNLLLWTYPQGDHYLPGDPLRLKSGISFLLRRVPGVHVVCVGITYTMFRRDKPFCTVAFEQLPRDTQGPTLESIRSASERTIRSSSAVMQQHAPRISKIF